MNNLIVPGFYEELRFSWTSCRIAYSAGYTKTWFCHWTMQNRNFHGFHEEWQSGFYGELRLHPPLVSWKVAFRKDFMKNCILHGFHEELHCLGDSWGIGFFMDFMKNSLFVCFVNNWILTGFQEEQHVSRNLWRIAFFVDFMSLSESISSRIAFFRTHEELYSSWIPWRIALLVGFVTNCSAFGLRGELHSSHWELPAWGD